MEKKPTIHECAMEAALELFREGNNHPSKKEICQRLYNGHSNRYTMASFNLLRVRDKLTANGASTRVVAVNHFYNHRRPPKEMSEVERCVRFGRSRAAMRLVFVRPTDESSRLLFEVSESENGNKGARKLAHVGKRIEHAIEEDCITFDRAKTIARRLLDTSTPALFSNEDIKSAPFSRGVTRLIEATKKHESDAIYLVGQCRVCNLSLTSPDPRPANICSKCASAA